ncbi:hypothetical protein BJX61DRAFT_538822 [Aspergillus egyptiacus]|nr:hypothetical protein BJX61DRAFT_538822 [Aspergillus egyptiacus]
MWILDSEGEFLKGKRVWLRPGKKYLFGRTAGDGVRHTIDARSISRKHLVIEVSPVKAGNGSETYTKSEILVTDLKSKVGSIVNGEHIRDKSKRLVGDEHMIQLGHYAHPLRIKWQPIVLTFSFSTKEDTPANLARFRSRLEDLDIKTVREYLTKATTHVVQSKRNTAKGLQALVNGKFIVDYSFIDALVYAATPSDIEDESLSPLEMDFDAAWPDEREHLPPPGKKEVNTKPAECFAPNPERSNVFHGYTFILGTALQYNNLRNAIADGHGKALKFDVKDGVTTAAEIVQFMRNAAGQKGLGPERDGDGGVVLVRFRSEGEYENWSIELGNQVALATDQRLVQQNEFIDAILANDASVLCRPLRQELEMGPTPTTPTSEPPPSSEDIQIVADSQPAENVSQPSKKAKSSRVRKYVSKMKTFDDGFDINSIPAYAPEVDGFTEGPPPMSMEAVPDVQSQQADGLQEEEDMVTSLLPGARAMKRLRAETSHRSLEDSNFHSKPEEVPRPKRQKLDVLEAARQHREAEEDAARQRRQQEEELLQSSLREVDVEKLKGLAIVEEMELPTKNTDDDNNRWDERWNGRKNFKKFRRKGESSQPRRRIQTVIVPLEEVARKDFGIGDHYWVSSRKSADRSPQDSHQDRAVGQEDSELSQRPSVARSGSEKTVTQKSQKRVREARDSDSDDELRFRFRRRR